MNADYRKTWWFGDDEEINRKIIVEYGNPMNITDTQAKEIVEKYLGVKVWDAEITTEDSIDYTTMEDKEDFERAEAEAEEDAEEYSRDPYSYNGVSRSDF